MEVAVERNAAARAAAGDSEAIRDLWRHHRRWVAAVLLAHMPSDAELDDLLQEVAVQFLRKITDLRDPDLLRPWLRTIAVNTARTAGRRRRVRLRLVRPSAGAANLDTMPERDAGDRAQAAAEARRALELCRELHADYGEPLLMRSVRGMTYQQIADAMGVPVTTIETRLARARRMLRDLMERDERPRAVPAAAGPRAS